MRHQLNAVKMGVRAAAAARLVHSRPKPRSIRSRAGAAKHVMLNQGYCPRHHIITVEQMRRRAGSSPDAHAGAPECKADVLAEADYIGSTAGIIKYAEESDASEFIIVTVRGVLYELERRCRGTGKKFYFPRCSPPASNGPHHARKARALPGRAGARVQIGVSDKAADQAKLYARPHARVRGAARTMWHEGWSLMPHSKRKDSCGNQTIPTWSATSSFAGCGVAGLYAALNLPTSTRVIVLSQRARSTSAIQCSRRVASACCRGFETTMPSLRTPCTPATTRTAARRRHHDPLEPLGHQRPAGDGRGL